MQGELLLSLSLLGNKTLLRGRVEEVVGKRDSDQSHNLVTRIQAEKVREFYM